MKGQGTSEVLPSFLLLAPSLLLPAAGYVMQSFFLQISGIWEGWWEMQQDLVKVFWPSSPVMEPCTLLMAMLLLRPPQHTSMKSHFTFLALCFVLVEEMKFSRFLLRGKEQAGIACLKPTNNIFNVAKAICRAWNETHTSLHILPVSPSLIWKQDTSLWVTSRLISEKPLARASGSWMRHQPHWSKPPASPTEASNWDKTRQTTSH